MKVLKLNSGDEYASKVSEAFMKAYGIQYQSPIFYTPQQNNIAKPTNCTLVEMACLILHALGRGMSFGEMQALMPHIHTSAIAFKALFIKLRQNGLNETFEKRVASFMQQIVVEPSDK